MREWRLWSTLDTLLQCFQVQFFAHLTVSGVISVSSFSALIQSFIAVLDELGVAYGRAKRAALVAAEGILRVRSTMSSKTYTLSCNL